MHAQHGAVNDGSDGEVVEEIGAEAPHVGAAVLAHAFVVEAIHLGDLAALMIATQEGDVPWVSGLECEQELEGFNAVVAAVNKVAHEDIAGGGHVATSVKELEEVMELAVDVAADGDGGAYRLHVALLHKKLLHLQWGRTVRCSRLVEKSFEVEDELGAQDGREASRRLRQGAYSCAPALGGGGRERESGAVMRIRGGEGKGGACLLNPAVERPRGDHGGGAERGARGDDRG